ncbi:hypothetical protein HYFRA_00009564 [Hymenoscyphus fraxineus]|uniref:Carboxylesterase type B domain-containing protein n=1 Tax=Hymenoscyphus fraxineus TaxID=746836 RepID=A0A9N9PTV9_9HELO|nr:hypothetical protein HYFRA_00009564 [Hymenoscyphus fraxineus]
MKSFSLGLVALSTFGILSNASVVHISLSNEKVEVDLVAEQESPQKNLNDPPTKNLTLEDHHVNLDYEIHGGNLTASGKYLSFKNIPYAQPPLNEYRWAPPQDIEEENPKINYGPKSYICPQTPPGWVAIGTNFVEGFNNKTWDAKWEKPINASDYGAIPKQSDLVSEDCLLLDVMVPKPLWESRKYYKAPVVVWIHGGEFLAGNKEMNGSPEGLLQAAGKDGDEIIFVAMNYRLGAFGWLGGEKFMSQGGLPNLGLHDQAFALQWVKKYIERFGGDSESITVMGQNSGASSIIHHITSYGGDKDLAPDFEAAIIQSPGFYPQANGTQDDQTFATFLNLTNSTDLQSLQKQNSSVLIQANLNMTWNSSPYGYYAFGPTVDGRYVPDLPSRLLKKGKFHEKIPLLMGHERLDGLLFSPPWIRTNQALQDWFVEVYPGAPNSTLGFIANNYTIPGKKSPPQLTLIGVSDFVNHISIECNNYYLTEASLKYSSSTPVWRYVFNALPAVNGYDVGYTFYPDKPPISPVNVPLASFFQQSLVNFIRNRNPNPEKGAASWDRYKPSKRRVMNLGKKDQLIADYTWESRDDTMLREKCAFWQSAPFYTPPLPPLKEPKKPTKKPGKKPEPEPKPEPKPVPGHDEKPLPVKPEPHPEPEPEPQPTEPLPEPEKPNTDGEALEIADDVYDHRELI